MKDGSKHKKKSVREKETEKLEAAIEQTSFNLEDSDNDDSGVDEKGLERLMTALGENGLDEIAQNMLKSLDENSDDNDGVRDSGVESTEEEEESQGDENDEGDDDEEEEEYVPKVKLRAGLSSDDDDYDDEDEGSDENEGEREIQILAKASKSSTLKHSTKYITSLSKDHGENEEMVALDEVSDVDEDVVPQQRLTVNNKRALESILASIQLDKSLSWTETLTTTFPQTHEVDVSNDLERELSFYKQALHCAEAAKKLAAQHSLPFTRPSDFFAEMVKSDVHMERTRQRLLDETAQIKKSQERRREREGKKFGKQVQIEKLKERERSKKDMNEKIQSLKRKRNNGTLEGGDDGEFDVALDEAMEDRPKKKAKMPRARRDEKYGFGGKGSVGWRSKQNTRDSTDQFISGKSGKNGKKGGKHVPKRPGKARRMAGRQK